MSKPARCDDLQNQLQQVTNVPAIQGGPTRIKQLHGFEMYFWSTKGLLINDSAGSSRKVVRAFER